ncbi:hypothetical protein F0U60_29550 [Archangium minus]|uniref:Uncharacterized protein n=1 Tax=Archangium minus TaxID=83450 RepID=A0ABY9WXE8_9BACT|nr:hypothetical protein F0U60_29550 [Archangium minus]
MNPWFLGLLLVSMLVLPLPFALRWWRRRQARRAWLALAPRLELSLVAGGDQRLLSGRYQGHPVEVLLSSDGTAQMRMTVQAHLPPDLHLSRQEAGSRRLQLRGLRDIQVGDAALDAAFVIQGSNPAAVIRLLREPGVRDALLALVAGNPQAVLTRNEVVAPSGYPVQEEPCRRALRALALVASTLERTAGQHAQLAASAREQAWSERLALATARPQAPLPPEPALPPVDKAPVERNVRSEYGRRKSLYFLFGQLPVAVGWWMWLLGGAFKHRHELLGLAPTEWGALGGVLFVLGIGGGLYGQLKLLRCPACDESLTQDGAAEAALSSRRVTRRNRTSLALKFSACPFCKTRLR